MRDRHSMFVGSGGSGNFGSSGWARSQTHLPHGQGGHPRFYSSDMVPTPIAVVSENNRPTARRESYFSNPLAQLYNSQRRRLGGSGSGNMSQSSSSGSGTGTVTGTSTSAFGLGPAAAQGREQQQPQPQPQHQQENLERSNSTGGRHVKAIRGKAVLVKIR